MRQYARQVDRALRPMLNGLEVPLIVAAAEPLDSSWYGPGACSRPIDRGPAAHRAGRRARRDGEDVHLTATEWQILGLLARNPGRLITQAQLLEHVWGLKDTKNNYVRVYLAAIRRKLEPEPAHPRYFGSPMQP